MNLNDTVIGHEVETIEITTTFNRLSTHFDPRRALDWIAVGDPDLIATDIHVHPKPIFHPDLHATVLTPFASPQLQLLKSPVLDSSYSAV